MDPETPRKHRVVRLDSRQIRALAHPLRSRLLAALRVDGPATATTLARLLDTNTGATSYHLRQLAEAGLVEEAPDHGFGRQRFWRAAHDASTWRTTDFDDDPDASAAAEWIQGNQVRFLADEAERWIAAQQEAPREWREAAELSDALLTLSPPRLRALNDELWQVVERYRTGSDLEQAGVKQVHVFLVSFPRASR